MIVHTSEDQKELTTAQRTAIERFPIGEWVGGPSGPQYGVHISTLNSLIRHGHLKHEPDPDLPEVIFGAGKPWTQSLKAGRFMRVDRGLSADNEK